MKSLPILLTLSVLAGGCATSGIESAGDTSSSLHSAALSVAKANTQIDIVLSELASLMNQPEADTQSQFRKFSSAVADLEATAGDVNTHAANMQQEGAAYFVKWNEELAKIQNEDIRTQSLDRKQAVSTRFDRVKASFARSQSHFTPFLSDLKDIRTALGTDLTAGGVASIHGISNQANSEARPLQELLRNLAADFESLGISLSSTSPAR